MATQYTTAQVADKLETSPRTLRKFLRSQEAGVGKGSRYMIQGKDLASLKKQFRTWNEAEATKKADRANAALDSADVPETDDEVEAIIDNA